MSGVNLVLFEHASGYALFRVKEFEEMSMCQAELDASVQDVSKFQSVVSLVAVLPFKSAPDADLDVSANTEGILTEDLKLFLQTNLPEQLEEATLGVLDPKLGAAINEAIGIKVSHVGVVPEVIRGIRQHSAELIKGLSNEASSKSQLGLRPGYSRPGSKFNVPKSDNTILQSITLLDNVDKDINMFSRCIRERFSCHFPGLFQIVPDDVTYAKCICALANKKVPDDSILEKLEEILMDSGKAQAIVDACKSLMDMDTSDLDIMHIERMANCVVALADYREEEIKYLKSKMGTVAPNLSALVGETIGAKLISRAGSLSRLAKFPSSTVQILGAEKALYRALKTKGKRPKHGLIFHSSFIRRAGPRDKGRLARYLAGKCSVAARMDFFSEVRTSTLGEKLKEEVENRLQSFDTCGLPEKNLDVMQEAEGSKVATDLLHGLSVSCELPSDPEGS